ncbi:MAG: precorrin-8X methylmutase [Lentisphaeria bacterium]
MNNNVRDWQDIDWNMSGAEVEAESFRRIDESMPDPPFAPMEWRVVRRLIHTTGDFSVADSIVFKNDPINAGLQALRAGAAIYCDAKMSASGISIPALRRYNTAYSEDSIHCLIGDGEVAERAREEGITRSLAAMEKARNVVDGGIVLIGNAPMALAALVRMIREQKAMPRLVIAMPVGFVHVREAKNMIQATEVPQIVLTGYRGGSPLAVATLHGIMK